MDYDWYFKLHSYEIEWQNKTECQTHRMEFTCALTIFCIDLESIRLSVKPSTKVGFNAYYKLHTDELETQNKTECQAPRMDFIGALPHLACFESFRDGVKHSSKSNSDGHCKLHVYEIETWNKLSGKLLEWTWHSSYLVFARISNPSDSTVNFPPKWVSTGNVNCMHTKSSHEMKLSTKYPEWTCYASPTHFGIHFECV